jgi:kinesin family member 11
MASKKPLSRGNSAAPTDETNVQVVLRCRPLSSEERAQRSPPVIKCHEQQSEVTITQSIAGKQFDRTYTFDTVFGPDTTQERLYSAAISPIVDEVLQGFNCTIFAYGQTGTGKTFTMLGGDAGDSASMSAAAGVIPRAIHQIFTHLEGTSCAEYTVKCSFLELYNEEITDLLVVGNDTPKVGSGTASLIVSVRKDMLHRKCPSLWW